MEKGIKAYHSYLSFGDAKEALSETVCEDLNLDDLCEQLDYTCLLYTSPSPRD